MTAGTIPIAYKCRCMSAEAEIEVRAREPAEDLADWMRDAVQEAMTADHGARSPLCTAYRVQHCKIPVPENAPFIGAAPRLDS